MRYSLFALFICVVLAARGNLSFIRNFDMTPTDTTTQPVNHYTGTITYAQDANRSYRKMTYTETSAIEYYITDRLDPSSTKSEYVTYKVVTCLDKCSAEKLTKAEDFSDKGSNSGSYITDVTSFGSSSPTGFSTAYNIYTLTLPSGASTYTLPSASTSLFAFAEKCLSTNCQLSIDLVFSLDNSGSMTQTRLDGAKNLMTKLLDRLQVKAGGSRAGFLKWSYSAVFLVPDTIDKIKGTWSNGVLNGGFATSASSVLAKFPGREGNTCFSCGYKAGVEMMYAQYLYELGRASMAGASKIEIKNTELGRILFILTDGEPNRYLKAGTDMTFSVSASNSNTYYSYDYYVSTTYSTHISTLKTSADNYYKGIKVSTTSSLTHWDSFYNKLIVIGIATYEASGKNVSYIGKTGSDAPAVKTYYTLTTLDQPAEMETFLSSISTTICDVYADADSSCNNYKNRPCCFGTIACPTSCSNTDKCKDNYCTPSSTAKNCESKDRCVNTDKCVTMTCNPSVGVCDTTAKPRPPTNTPAFNHCYTFTCKPSDGLWYKSGLEYDCKDYYKEQGDYKECKVYRQCDQTYYDPDKINTPDKWNMDRMCKIEEEDFCTCPDGYKYGLDELKTTLSECTRFEMTEDEYDHHGVTCREYKVVPIPKKTENCIVYDCVVKKFSDGEDDPEDIKGDDKYAYNETSYWYATKTPILCTGCSECNLGSNSCVETPEFCTSSSNPDWINVSAKGCYHTPQCTITTKTTNGVLSGNGVCDTVFDLFDECTHKSACRYGECDSSLDPPACTIFNYPSTKLHCYDVLGYYSPDDCHFPVCNEALGGCFYALDGTGINACGECGSGFSCDPTTAIVAASVAAGVVAAIVIAAVVALVIAAIASKKMYDLISASNESKMDAAQENALYKENDAGGANPLFEQ